MKSAVLWQSSHDNNFVITCRIATREYTEEFTEVEVADFDQVQIASLQPSGLRQLTRSRVTDLSTSSNKIPPIQESGH